MYIQITINGHNAKQQVRQYTHSRTPNQNLQPDRCGPVLPLATTNLEFTPNSPTFVMNAFVRCCQMQARTDREFRKSSKSPASGKQIDRSSKARCLEIVMYLLFVHNEHIII